MKIILKNSSIEMQKNVPSGTEVEFFPDFVNSDHPSSGGWVMKNDGDFRQYQVWANKAGVSDIIPVDGYSKVKVTGAKGNEYISVAAFYDDAADTIGTSPLVITTDGDGEVNVPSGASYVRFGASLTSSGDTATNCRYFMVAE